MEGSFSYDGAGMSIGLTPTYTTNRSFTGQMQDVLSGPTGIYDFLFRQQASNQGRWLVPDPAGLAAVDITNPQTWNRYAYVGNNPLSNVDPLGLDPLGPVITNITVYSGFDPFNIGNYYSGDFGIGGGGGSPDRLKLQGFDGPGEGRGVVGRRLQPQPDPPAASDPTPEQCPKGFGGGLTAGAAGQLGILATGGVAEGSLSGGIFHNSNSGTTMGGVSSGGATAYAGSHTAGIPQQGNNLNDRFVAGEFLGASGGFFFTNAGSAAAMASTKSTLSINLGYGYAASFNISGGGGKGIWSVSVNFGFAFPGLAVSFQNTASKGTGTLCK